MARTLYLIVNLCALSLALLYLAFQYITRKKYGKTAQTIALWGVFSLLLLDNHRADGAIPGFILSCTVLTLIGHCLVGDYLGLYARSITYDRWLHALGSFSFALLAFFLLHHNVFPFEGGRFYASLFVATLGVSLGTLFEIAEFISDRFAKGRPGQHGLVDTDFDLIFNLFGAVIAGLATPYFL